MSIRRKRRQRGKRKARIKQALAAWKVLQQASTPPSDWFAEVANMIPMVRILTPDIMAKSLVTVQPSGMSPSLLGCVVTGIEPMEVNLEVSNRVAQKTKRAQRKAKKRRRSTVAKAQRNKSRSNERCSLGIV